MSDRGHEVNEKTDPTPNTIKLMDTAVNGLNKLFDSEMRRVDERFSLFSEHLKEMGIAESKRLDAIREVDATAVRVAADRALNTQATLASQVSAFNEQQRALVATTADVLAKNLQQIQIQIAENAEKAEQQQQIKNDAFLAAIALIQKTQNESQGKSSMSTPLLMVIAGAVVGVIVFIIEALVRI